MKGISLGINVVILLVIAVIILIVSILLFTQGTKLPINMSETQAGLSSECLKWSSFGYNASIFTKENFSALYTRFSGDYNKALLYCQTLKG